MKKNVLGGLRHRFVLTCLFFLHVFMASPSSMDSVRVSLLTCSPGSRIYTLFGHTAIRYQDFRTKRDWVFNYGMFSFRSPNFIARFVKGETDYMLGVEYFDSFEAEYRERGSSVFEQELYLSATEKSRLIRKLKWNSREENRVYRYNFLYDNCTTRARDRIEECLLQPLLYKEVQTRLSFRDIIHEYTHEHAWSQFGMDFCLGAPADAVISSREQLFAPFYLLAAFDSATVMRPDSGLVRLAHPATLLIPACEGLDLSEHYWFTPLTAGWCFFAVVLFVTLYGLRCRRRLWGVDFVLSLLVGVSGSVIAFLVFVSVHPAVSPNYLLLVFHPIHLFYLPYLVFVSVKKKIDYFQMLNAFVLTLFMTFFWLIPQKINSGIVPLVAILWLRAMSYIYLRYIQRKVAKNENVESFCKVASNGTFDER